MKIKEETFARLEEIMKAMSNASRLKILFTIFKNERCVNDIVKLSGISQSIVSQSLCKFQILGLVELKKMGNRHIYCVKDEKLFEILKQLREYANEK